MKLEMLRTAKPEAAGGRFYVIDNDLPLARKYDALFVGSAEACGQYIDAREGGRAKPPVCVNASQAGDTWGIGSSLLNVGRILNHRTEGAFVYVDVETSNWSMTTGTPNRHVDNLVFHQSDELWIEG